ncbi:MAG TPA: hypothetical protein VMP01_04650 [Pirellulaceae bacterium]|nr:hypothetical protein [Pirellulaceae bacterium]
MTGIDPDHGATEPLFNPRRQRWYEHFELVDGIVIGKTATGRVTVRVLNMNKKPWPKLRSRHSNVKETFP